VACQGQQEPKETETVTFPDENLEAAIRDALGKPVDGEITIAELTELTALRASSSDIVDLSGLEYCASLTELNLWHCQISDITPLQNLTNLTDLWLMGHQINDISPLSNLTSLTLLCLRWNQISDISPIANLTSLTELQLGDNQVSDISTLSNLTSLTKLFLMGNQINDITPLVENNGLGTGDEVRLEDNNLDLGEGSEDMENIGVLEDRGVDVRY
jgi:internalin A